MRTLLRGWLLWGSLFVSGLLENPARAQVSNPDEVTTPLANAPATTDGGSRTDEADPGLSRPGADEAPLTPRSGDLIPGLKKKEEKKPPKLDYEVQAIRAAPSNGLPFVKLNHWTQWVAYTVANNFDAAGELSSNPEPLPDPAHRTRYVRPYELVKGELKGLVLPAFLSSHRTGGPVTVSLSRERGSYPVAQIGATPQFLAPHQFLLVVLAEVPSRYYFLNDLHCVRPAENLSDGLDSQQRFYYRWVAAQTPKDLLLPPSVLFWTTTSHLLWDDLQPSKLSGAQQTALFDWLYWGGQLIVSGGAAGTALDRSFLDPYLPADSRGTVRLETLDTLKQFRAVPRRDELLVDGSEAAGAARKPGGSGEVHILPGEALVAARLELRPGARALLAEGEHVIVAERQVGRGRVVQTALPLSELLLVERSRYDEFFRALILRQPKSLYLVDAGDSLTWQQSAGEGQMLPAAVLSRLRFFGRDTGVPQAPRPNDPADQAQRVLLGLAEPSADEAAHRSWTPAAWRDDNAVATAAREAILEASGIDVPRPGFVAAMIVGYAGVLVGLNWLVFRLLGRVEWAWAAVPVIAIACAAGVVRLARWNIGYDSQASEVTVVEAFGGYPRAHVTRITGIYNTSRMRYRLTYPDQTALALPFPSGTRAFRGQRVEEVTASVGRPFVVEDFQVHPRSIGMVHAEQMFDLEGPVSLTLADAARGQLSNGTKFDLEGARLYGRWGMLEIGRLEAGGSYAVELTREGPPKVTPLAAGSPPGDADSPKPSAVGGGGELNPEHMLRLGTEGIESDGEIRLVAWTRTLVPGQVIEPAVARRRGVTLFVAHLAMPALPPPDVWGGGEPTRQPGAATGSGAGKRAPAGAAPVGPGRPSTESGAGKRAPAGRGAVKRAPR